MLCMPLVPRSDNDLDGVYFEIWAEDDAGYLDYTPTRQGYGIWVNEQGTVRGYADAEDDTIYADPSCLPSHN